MTILDREAPYLRGHEGLLPGSTPVALGTQLLWCGRTLWIELHGVLNWCTTDVFREHIQAGLARPCRRVVLDLTDVEYVCGNGLHALLRLQEELASRGIELRLVVPEGSRCARTIALAKLQGVLRTFARPVAAWRHRERLSHAAGLQGLQASLRHPPPPGLVLGSRSRSGGSH